MSRAGEGAALCQIKGLLQWGSACGWTDRQLLERFSSRRDASAEAAFAALVARHGPMVLSVCRDRVRDLHLAEDAFQAVFFVLAQSQVDSRLRAAGQLALRSRHPYLSQGQCPAGRRYAKEETRSDGLDPWNQTASSPVATDEPVETVMQRSECATILHDELARLPRRFRTDRSLLFRGVDPR